jgi:hypothetical protein
MRSRRLGPTFRYPAEDDDLDVPKNKYEEAVRLAMQVIAWVESVLTALQPPSHIHLIS